MRALRVCACPVPLVKVDQGWLEGLVTVPGCKHFVETHYPCAAITFNLFTFADLMIACGLLQAGG